VYLTFDDGFASSYNVVYPTLEKYSFIATLYPISHEINRPGFITSGQLAEMRSSPFFNIGGHTNRLHEGTCEGLSNSGILQCVSPSVARYDLGESARILNNNLISFAYPFGGYEGMAIESVINAGYKFAVTEDYGYALQTHDPYRIPRITITSDMTIEQFKKVLDNQNMRSIGQKVDVGESLE